MGYHDVSAPMMTLAPLFTLFIVAFAVTKGPMPHRRSVGALAARNACAAERGYLTAAPIGLLVPDEFLNEMHEHAAAPPYCTSLLNDPAKSRWADLFDDEVDCMDGKPPSSPCVMRKALRAERCPLGVRCPPGARCPPRGRCPHVDRCPPGER